MKLSTFVVLPDKTTLLTIVTPEGERQPVPTGGYTDLVGYFAHEGKCFTAVETASKRGTFYWKVEGSSKLGGVRCQKHGHIHE